MLKLNCFSFRNQICRTTTAQISICQVFEKTLFSSKNQNQDIISNFQQKNIHALLLGHGTNYPIIFVVFSINILPK